MRKINSEILKDLIKNPPKVHIWAGEEKIGGFTNMIANRLVDFIDGHFGSREFNVLETGAGFTTLMFKTLGATTVTSIDPTDGLEKRILDEAKRRGVDAKGISIIGERSEIALPKLTDSGFECDVFLIDGAHGWPYVFVDFCFGYMCLRKGGLLLLDDVQLYSVRQLMLFLCSQPGFTCLSAAGDWKLAAFTKDTDEVSITPWETQQPYIMANTGYK